MKTILSILIMFYFIVVVFIMIEKKIKTTSESKLKKIDAIGFGEAYESSRKWMDYSANLKSAPFLDGYDRPDM